MTRNPHEVCPRCHGVIERGRASSLEAAVETHLASCPTRSITKQKEEPPSTIASNGKARGRRRGTANSATTER